MPDISNKLIFNGKEYELIESEHHRFIVFDEKMRYGDIGNNINPQGDETRYSCLGLHIGTKFYALKIIENN
tara:strand:- start:1830 stop:2042 length:213 start_codon:yes stop_codon:yes gene_type:complete